MVLVLYCGAVIFVTKPNSFAYDAIFANNEASVPARTVQQPVAAEPVDTEAIVAQAEAAAREVASQSSESIRKAIEDSIPALVDQAVKNAMAEYDISEQVASKVTQDVLSQKDDFAAMIYDSYKESLVDEVAKEVIARIDSAIQSIEPETKAEEQVAEPQAPVEETPSALSVEEYEAQRQEIRDIEINSLLEKLGE